MMNRSILEGDFDLPSAPFPSLEALPSTSSQRKRKQERTQEPLHFLATSATALSQELSNNNAANKEASRKTKAEELAPKRPVGRPRLHPKKELDPNRVRRVARGDKPLGRPRTAHLKPPVVKRPRGRPRKDASTEAIVPYSASSMAKQSNSFASGLYSIIAASADLQNEADRAAASSAGESKTK